MKSKAKMTGKMLVFGVVFLLAARVGVAQDKMVKAANATKVIPVAEKLAKAMVTGKVEAVKAVNEKVPANKNAKLVFTRYYSVRTGEGTWTWTTVNPAPSLSCDENPGAYCFIDSDVVPTTNSVPASSHISNYGPSDSSYQ